MSAQPFEIRLARLEGTYEQVDKRLDTIHADVRDLRAGMDLRFDSLDRKIDGVRDSLSAKIDGNFRTMLGTMVALIAALGAFLHFVH
ncbi:MAG: hypothetical protein ACYDG0_03960 [Vulcanimicrobiaceae bacterium]